MIPQNLEMPRVELHDDESVGCLTGLTKPRPKSIPRQLNGSGVDRGKRI